MTGENEAKSARVDERGHPSGALGFSVRRGAIAWALASTLSIVGPAHAQPAQDVQKHQEERVYGDYGTRGQYVDPERRNSQPPRRATPAREDPGNAAPSPGISTDAAPGNERVLPEPSRDVPASEPTRAAPPSRPVIAPTVHGWYGETLVAGGQIDQLGKALERYRSIEASGGWKPLPTDRPMALDQTHECSRLEALERRLDTEGYLEFRGSVASQATEEPQQCPFGQELAEAVMAFQADRGLAIDGAVGPATVRELNRSAREIVGAIERNIQRWRDTTLDTSGDFILVNVPFFQLSVFGGGREKLNMAVIVGLPSWPTPFFSDSLEYLVVNPDWGIPDSIATKEIWPTAKRDQGYFAREGIVQSSTGGLRQKPGPKNPLGKIKFMMPNEHNVYLHDTPGKRSFSLPSRALSHGCVRVSKPMELAEYLLRDDPRWSPEKLQATINAGKMVHVTLQQQMPVHIVYFTARVNAEGRLELRNDVYKEDAGLQVAKGKAPAPVAKQKATAPVVKAKAPAALAPETAPAPQQGGASDERAETEASPEFAPAWPRAARAPLPTNR